MIRVLEKSVADKIAAGEVIERPVSVVKELVENSIDAGASLIVVEIKKGGIDYIRVTDDGCGIPKDDTERAFLRHATSKIERAEDLDSLFTLGFRGEALASIAAVSRTDLITKTKEEKTGTDISIEGSDVVAARSVGCPDGTTITVSDLFYNTPARRKFLSTQAAESTKVTALITRMAMAYPDIKFRMISNGNVLFSTRGTGDRLDAIITIFGRSDARNLIAIDHEEDGIKVTGYVSGPGQSKANRSGQIFFVNGRDVESKIVQKGLESAFKERLFDGRYPIGYLFIDVDAAALDVNIHPNKKQVRFDDEKKVMEVVTHAVSRALETREAAPEIFPEIPETTATPAKTEASSAKTEAAPVRESAAEKPAYQIKNRPSFTGRVRDNRDITQIYTANANKKAEQVDVKELLSTFRKENERAVTEIEQEAKRIEETKSSQRFSFASLSVVGVIFNTYILAQDEDTFYLIDQHAAHERVFFEEFRARMEKGADMTQQIMLPFTASGGLEPGPWMEQLRLMGYDIEEFGPRTYIVRGIPTVFDTDQAEQFLKDFIDTYEDPADFESTVVRDKLALRACKAAVKAHDILKDEEISRLLTDLDSCSEPFSCPHGRPTYIKMTLSELERRFKRA